jgi:hypothetical protein
VDLQEKKMRENPASGFTQESCPSGGCVFEWHCSRGYISGYLAARSDKESKRWQTGGGIKDFVTGDRGRSPEKDATPPGK